jgi:hypothetical protein
MGPRAAENLDKLAKSPSKITKELLKGFIKTITNRDNYEDLTRRFISLVAQKKADLFDESILEFLFTTDNWERNVSSILAKRPDFISFNLICRFVERTTPNPDVMEKILFLATKKIGVLRYLQRSPLEQITDNPTEREQLIDLVRGYNEKLTPLSREILQNVGIPLDLVEEIRVPIYTPPQKRVALPSILNDITSRRTRGRRTPDASERHDREIFDSPLGVTDYQPRITTPTDQSATRGIPISQSPTFRQSLQPQANRMSPQTIAFDVPVGDTHPTPEIATLRDEAPTENPLDFGIGGVTQFLQNTRFSPSDKRVVRISRTLTAE